MENLNLTGEPNIIVRVDYHTCQCDQCPKENKDPTKLQQELLKINGVHTVDIDDRTVMIKGTVDHEKLLKHVEKITGRTPEMLYYNRHPKLMKEDREKTSTGTETEGDERPSKANDKEKVKDQGKAKEKEKAKSRKKGCGKDRERDHGHKKEAAEEHVCEDYVPVNYEKVCRDYFCTAHPRGRKITDRVSSKKQYGMGLFSGLSGMSQGSYGGSPWPVGGSYHHPPPQSWWPPQEMPPPNGFYPPPGMGPPPFRYY